MATRRQSSAGIRPGDKIDSLWTALCARAAKTTTTPGFLLGQVWQSGLADSLRQ
jgi:hypothetical protein